MSKQRFFIATSGNDDEAYKEAMQYACKVAANDSEIKKVVLLIHTKQNTGWFERLFGSDTVKQLFRGTTFKNCGPVFKFETKKTYNDGYTPSEIVISCALDSDDVFPIDDFYSVKAIIAIPWLANGLDKWVQTWNPTEIRGNQQAVKVYPEPTCIVKKAMQDLTDSINMSTGISHPSDEEQAKTYILALHKYEDSLNADIVGSYLVKELNWDTDHAKDIEKLINTLNNGKFFKGGRRTGLQNYYKQWKNDCGQ
jgi:predicted component of type VI protein secretion system